MKYWFTSDFHLGHANIIKYCSRTLFMTKKDREIYNNLAIDKQSKWKISRQSLNNMNREIIRRHNERVKKEDLVFFIGDFCFKSKNNRGEGIGITAKEWKKKLNGQFIFIKGNHDRNNSCKTIIERLVIGYGGKRINLVHNPEFADVNYKINFVGHVHNNWKIKRIKKGWQFTDCINVGVDVHNFYPQTFEELMKKYYKWKNQNDY